MENYNKIDVKGQVLFVEPTWVTGETCLFNIKNPIQYAQAKSKLTKIRKDFISRLEKEGFIITYDESDIKNDTVCLIMNSTTICNTDVATNVYKKVKTIKFDFFFLST